MRKLLEQNTYSRTCSAYLHRETHCFPKQDRQWERLPTQTISRPCSDQGSNNSWRESNVFWFLTNKLPRGALLWTKSGRHVRKFELGCLNGEEEEEDKFDPELKQPRYKRKRKWAEQLKDFAQFNRHEELSLAVSKVSDMLHKIKLRSPKLQTTITDFFTSCWIAKLY